MTTGASVAFFIIGYILIGFIVSMSVYFSDVYRLAKQGSHKSADQSLIVPIALLWPLFLVIIPLSILLDYLENLVKSAGKRAYEEKNKNR